MPQYLFLRQGHFPAESLCVCVCSYKRRIQREEKVSETLFKHSSSVHRYKHTSGYCVISIRDIQSHFGDGGRSRVLVAGGAPDAAQSASSLLEDVERRSYRMSGEGGSTAALSAEMNKNLEAVSQPGHLVYAQASAAAPLQTHTHTDTSPCPSHHHRHDSPVWTQKESLASSSVRQCLLCISCNLQTSQRPPDYNEEGASRWRIRTERR